MDAPTSAPQDSLDSFLFDTPPPRPAKRKPRKWLRPVIALAVLALLGAGAGVAYGLLAPEEEAADDAARSYRVTLGDIRVSYDADGSVSLPYAFADAEYSAELLELNVQKGDTFQKGDVLARMSDESLLEAIEQKQDALDEANEAVLSAENAVADAAASLESAKRGLERQKLSYSDTLSSLSDSKAQALKAVQTQQKAVRNAEGHLADAQEKLEQMMLFPDDYAGQELDAQRAAVADAQDALDTERGTLSDREEEAGTVSGSAARSAQLSLSDAEDSVAKAETAVTRAESGLESAKRKALKAEQALAEAEAELASAQIVAPADGIVAAVNYEVGDEVPVPAAASASASLIVYRESGKLYTATAAVPELDVAQVWEGQPVELVIEAWGEEVLTGTVTALSSFASSGNNGVITYECTVAFAADDPGIRDQMNCTLTFIATDVPDVLSVPNDALYTENGKTYVDVQLPDGTAERREVTTGFSDGSVTEIQSGLTAGTTVLSRTLTGTSSRRTEDAEEEEEMMPGGMPMMPEGGFAGGGPDGGMFFGGGGGGGPQS